MTCPWCPTTTPTWTALHAHFAQVHVGDPQSAHRRDPLGRNGIGGCRLGVSAAQHGTLVAQHKTARAVAPTTELPGLTPDKEGL